MKKLRAVASICLGLVMLSGGVMVGCRSKGDSGVDATKSQLTIGNYEGGLGDQWLKEIAENFMADYADYSFEDGKTGCQIWVDSRKEYAGDQLVATIPYGEASIICTQSCPYSNLAGQGILKDVTAWVSEDIFDENMNMVYDADGNVTSTGATHSILDFLQSEYEEYYNINDKYYGMPFSQMVGGMWYDADLFDSKGFYFFADGSLGAKQIDIDEGRAGPGPDGKMETKSDNGLPETWSDFMTLMDTMKTSVTPFTWAGATNYQRSWFYNALVAQYEGYDDMALNYSLLGQDKSQPEINVTNEYEVSLLAQQNGRKAAPYMVRDIVQPGYFSSAAFNGAQTHTGAQREFLESTNTTRPIAMFIEGSYWLNEARDVCDEMEQINPEWGYSERNIRYMTIPYFDEHDGIPAQASHEIILNSQLDDTAILVKSNLECEELTKLFYQYMHSRESMVICEKNTLTFRPFNYELEDDEYEELPKPILSLRNLIDDGAKIVNNLPRTTLYANSQDRLNNFPLARTLISIIWDLRSIFSITSTSTAI